MTDEEIEKIARRVLELQTKDGVKAIRNTNQIADITKKYHRQMYDKFGSTTRIEDAIRVVVTYSEGERYLCRLDSDGMQRAKEFAEFLYKKILGIGE